MTGVGHTSRAGPRSLKSALFEAGLGEPPREEHGPSASELTRPAKPQRSARLGAIRRASPAISLFETPDPSDSAPPLLPASHARTGPAEPAYGVVSPPPWLREARRGRRHARVLNTFGWVTTLVVVGAAIGVAGHFLAVPLPGLEGIQSARQ